MDEQLPIGLEPGAGESASSFCLRSMSIYGLNMHWLRRTLSMSYSGHVTSAQEAQLTHLFHAPRGWFSKALPIMGSLEEPGLEYQRQHLSAYAHVRLRHPQVCPACVHANGFCSLAWDFSFLTVCIVHRQPLVDSCVGCGRSLSWNRLAIDVCICGRPLRAAESAGLSIATVIFSQAINAHLEERPMGRRFFTDHGLPEILADVSLNGLCFLIHAFGILDYPFAPTPSHFKTRLLSNTKWMNISNKGYERLALLKNDALGIKQIEALVSMPILDGLKKNIYSSPDTQIAHLILGHSYVEVGQQINIFNDI